MGTDDDENQGFFQKFWPSEVSSRQIPRSVSFVTDDDSQETNKEEELELNENYEDMYYTDEDDQKSQHTHNTNTNVGGTGIGAMTDIGGVFFRKKDPKMPEMYACWIVISRTPATRTTRMILHLHLVIIHRTQRIWNTPDTTAPIIIRVPANPYPCRAHTHLWMNDWKTQLLITVMSWKMVSSPPIMKEQRSTRYKALHRRTRI